LFPEETMTTGSETLYFVLREGSTREEQWSWTEVEELCRSGELTPQARIFLPDEERWAAIAETRLAPAASSTGSPPADPAEDEARAAIEAEYTAALERVAEDPDLLEAQLDAGMLAHELGRRDESRSHFQTVLHRYPYHARAAAEVHRRFNKVEQKSFRYLDRPAPIWEDLGDLLRMPLGRGPLYVVIPAAVFFGLSFVPGGAIVTAALMCLWAFQIMEYTARGASKPAEWNRCFADPWRKLGRPALLMAGVFAQWFVLGIGIAKLALIAGDGTDGSLWQQFTQNPVLLVGAILVSVLYFPVAIVSIGGFSGPAAKTLDPRRLVRTIVRMEHEYVYSVLLIAGLAFVLGVVRITLGAIPVAGDIVFGAALACATPMFGLILGRLLGRMGHVIE
jgi:hypothetical protein